jgi:hypothetical protein
MKMENTIIINMLDTCESLKGCQKMKTTVIINEQHTLLPEQEAILKEKFGAWTEILVPATGWTKEERDIICNALSGNVVFVSPIGGMILDLAFVYGAAPVGMHTVRPFVFSNDNREKKELPNGKVISVTAQTGWYLE